MSILNSRSSLVLILTMAAAIGFGAGIVCAGGAIASMDRVLRDYDGLVTDFDATIQEVNRKKLNLSEEKRKELGKDLEKLEKELAEQQAARERAHDIWKDLQGFFGSAGGEDYSPAPGRKRP